VRVAVSLKLLIEIGMGVQVQDPEPGMLPSHAAKHRVGDRVVAAEEQRTATRVEDGRDGLFDPAAGVAPGLPVGEPEVAFIVQPTVLEIDARLGPGVPGLAPERLTYRRRRRGGAALIRRAGIVGDSE
jgi:hypothetical protein